MQSDPAGWVGGNFSTGSVLVPRLQTITGQALPPAITSPHVRSPTGWGDSGELTEGTLMPSNARNRKTAGRGGCVLALLSVGSLLLGVQPAQSAGQHGWDFFDASPGCHNAIRKVHVSPAKSPTVKRILVRGLAGHAVSVEDARPHKVLFLDFNCRTSRSTIKIARIGSQVTKTTLHGPTKAFLEATFDASGRHAVIGWSTAAGVNVVKVSVATGNVVSRRSWSGIGYLDGLDSGSGSDIYIQVSGWTASSGQSTRVLDWSGNQLEELFVKRDQSFMHMSVSSFDVIGIATDTSPGRLFIQGSAFPFSRIEICTGNSPQNFTWLDYRVGLAHCSTDIGGSRYQFIDLRGATPKKAWLGRFWGIQPVGLG